jgi:hypothetical protein
MFKVREKCNQAMQNYKRFFITLEQLNLLRHGLGRPPVKGYYVKHVKVCPSDFYSGKAFGAADPFNEAQNLRSD